MIADVKAGWVDFWRTPSPRASDANVGGWDYRTGFIAGLFLRSAGRLLLSLTILVGIAIAWAIVVGPDEAEGHPSGPTLVAPRESAPACLRRDGVGQPVCVYDNPKSVGSWIIMRKRGVTIYVQISHKRAAKMIRRWERESCVQTSEGRVCDQLGWNNVW